MNKYYILLSVFFTVLFSISGEESLKKAIFSEGDLKRIYSGEIVSRMYLKFNTVGENTDEFIKVPATRFTEDDYSDYEMVCDEKAFIPYVLNDESKLAFYNTLSGFSKLKGADYWTFNGGKRVEFIVDSFSIDNPRNRRKVEDTKFTKINDRVELYYQQEDNRFGKLAFKSELYNVGDSFVVINSTLDSIFVVTRPGEYRMISFFIYDHERKGFLYYTVSAMRIRSSILLKSGKLYATTFSNRLRGGTVHLTRLLGLDWSDKIVTWDINKLKQGGYRNY